MATSLAKFALSDIAAAEYMAPQEIRAREAAPVIAVTTAGNIYVSGTSPTLLAAGNDTTGTGLVGAPYATLTKALSMVPAGGDYTIHADGTFAENTSAGGRWIPSGNFTLPVVVKPYLTASYAIQNASGTNGVVCFRTARLNNLQIVGATITPTTDGCVTILSNPVNSGAYASNILFADCTIQMRTASSRLHAIDLATDWGVQGLWFVRCNFQKIVGGNTTFNPLIMRMSSYTDTPLNQPHKWIGFWDCETTNAEWTAFSSAFVGADNVTFVRNTFSTSLEYAFLLGVDGSTITPAVTSILVKGNKFNAHGSSAHGLEIGNNCQDAVVIDNEIYSVLQGLLFKNAVGGVAAGNSIKTVPSGAGGSALYIKGSSDVEFIQNHVIVQSTGNYAYGFREAPDGAVLASGAVVRDNTFDMRGTAMGALFWGDGTESSGGARADRNVYKLTGGAVMGEVRGVTVTTLAEIQAAWVSGGLTGDVATNDANSSLT